MDCKICDTKFEHENHQRCWVCAKKYRGVSIDCTSFTNSFRCEDCGGLGVMSLFGYFKDEKLELRVLDEPQDPNEPNNSNDP